MFYKIHFLLSGHYILYINNYIYFKIKYTKYKYKHIDKEI